MFGIDGPEFLVIAIVAIVVIGPKELPRALHTAGKFVRKIKLLSADIQKSLDNVMEEAELDTIVRDANKIGGKNMQFEIERQITEEENKKNGTTA